MKRRSFIEKSLIEGASTWNNLNANQKAWEKLEGNENRAALDAVEAGVRAVESDPGDRSVGYGGRPDSSGEVTLDACIMDQYGNYGAVNYLKEIKHPISVARAVMEKSPHAILSGEGAQKFALKQGFKKENLLTDLSEKEYQEWKIKAQYKTEINIEKHDTIGLLAIDSNQNISGGCSTSGMAYKLPGRVGDSPIIGSGLFVDNEIGAATATGLGEEILKIVGAFLIVELMRNGKTPQQACEEAVMRVAKKPNAKEIQVAFIAVNKAGDIGAYSLQPGFVYALYQNGINKGYTSSSYFK